MMGRDVGTVHVNVIRYRKKTSLKTKNNQRCNGHHATGTKIWLEYMHIGGEIVSYYIIDLVSHCLVSIGYVSN